MPFDRFMIAPYTTGLETDLRPWLIPDDAFADLRNAYIFRGRIRKRVGEELTGYGWPNAILAPYFSRLSYNIGTTDGSGNAAGTAPGTTNTPIYKIGQAFVVGTSIFTVYQANGAMLAIDTAAIPLSPTGTFNTATGAYTITGAPANTAIYFFPAEPVMGLTQYLSGTENNYPSYAFDTQFAYKFTGGRWVQTGTGVWHGNNTNYFWVTNFFSAATATDTLYITNFQVKNPNGARIAATDDPIWTFDGTSWATFTPTVLAAGDKLFTARIIVPFHNCLLALNTIELNAAGTTYTNFINRCRFSAFGYDPTNANAWLETPLQTGSIGGGRLDASTEEEIISAEFIKDRLIVFFERSTWEIVYTANAIQPFVWQKINTELGSESTFSSVPFDREILTIGNTGVHSCTGANVERIDVKIPDFVFTIIDKQTGVQRVAGIRDYFAELVYWTFPSTEQNPNETFCTQILVFNYRNRTWAVFTDVVTVWGYFEQQFDTSFTWADQILNWEEANFAWDSGSIELNFRQVIAGNPEGFVFVFHPDVTTNASVLQITNMAYNAINDQLTLTVIDHTIDVGEYIQISNAQGVTIAGKGIYPVVSVTPPNTVVISLVNDNVPLPHFSGLYNGGGVITRISNYLINSKQWNPYDKVGRSLYLAKIDFLVDNIPNGQVTVDYFPSSSGASMVQDGIQTGAIMGTGILEFFPYDPKLYPLEQAQVRLWHPIYFQTVGESVQILITLSPAQIIDPAIAEAGMEIHAMILYTQPTSQRLQ